MTFVANLAEHESPSNSSQTTGTENAFVFVTSTAIGSIREELSGGVVPQSPLRCTESCEFHSALPRRGVPSVRQLEADIRSFIDRHNQNPRPFKWTKSADQILASVKRFCHKAQQTLCGEL